MRPRAVSNILWEVYLEAKQQIKTEQDEAYLKALGSLLTAFENDNLELVQTMLEKGRHNEKDEWRPFKKKVCHLLQQL